MDLDNLEQDEHDEQNGFIEQNGQNVPVNFDEANQAAAALFDSGGEPPSGNDIVGDGVPDVPPAEIPLAPQVQQMPQEDLLRRAFGENQRLQADNQRLQQLVQQMNDAQKQNVVDEALAMPVLDLSTIAFDDENAVGDKQNKYAKDMLDFAIKGVMKEISPFIEQSKEGMRQKEKADVIAALSGLSDLQGFGDMLPQLDNIMANNKLFSADVPLDEKYMTAYLIANGINGVNSRNKPREDALTPEKFMKFYQSNPELRDLVDKHRLEEIRGSQDVPPLSPSAGAVNAALNIPKVPVTFDEANEMARKKYFGGS